MALLAVSGSLLARASQHPNIVVISVAVVMVRALSVGRGLLRYLERLFSHDVAFRVLADVRVAIYRRLERLAPAGLAAFLSGDMLTTLISDVDATQDLFIRGIAPPLTAALVGAGATAHLDPDNRRALTADMLAATADRITLLITHDLEGLEGLDQVDEIVVLEHGRVAERGTHAQLIRADGTYKRLWEASR